MFRARQVITGASLTAGLSVSVLALPALPAGASTQPIHIVNTNGLGVNLRPTPDTSQPPVGNIPEGASPNYICYTRSVNVGGTPIWFKVEWQDVTGYYTSFYDDVPVAKQGNLEGYYGIPRCGTGTDINQTPSDNVTVNPAPTIYDRQAAVDWALEHARDLQSPLYSGCTWFVSQALWYGGLPKSDTWNDQGTRGKSHTPGTLTATLAGRLLDYLKAKYAVAAIPLDFSQNSVPQAQPGDIIAYDWGKKHSEGIDHLAFVVNIASGQYPEVAEWGTVDYFNPNHRSLSYKSDYVTRGWTWSQNDGHWLQWHSPRVKAYLLHFSLPGPR